jgi:hypothetical protein
MDMAFPLVWVLISLAIVAVVFRSKKRTTEASQVSASKTRVRGAIAIIILALGVVNGALRLSRQMQNRSALHNLAADSVEYIQIGGTRLEKASDVNSVVDAISNSQWYVHTAGDGGWAQAVSLVIHLKSGEERRYRVGRMLRQEGAVIDFISQDPSSQFLGHYGYALTKTLPHALDGAAAPLPQH